MRHFAMKKNKSITVKMMMLINVTDRLIYRLMLLQITNIIWSCDHSKIEETPRFKFNFV